MCDQMAMSMISINNIQLSQKDILTLIYPPHFEDVSCQSGANHIFKG